MRQAPELPPDVAAAATAVLGGQGLAGPMAPLVGGQHCGADSVLGFVQVSFSLPRRK